MQKETLMAVCYRTLVRCRTGRGWEREREREGGRES